MSKAVDKLGLDWFNVGFIGAVHLVAVLGFITFSWKALAVCVAIWWITGGLGITLGFHRLLTHQSFTAPRWVARFLTVCGTLAVQGGPIAWVAGHRVHHAHSDREKDPHNSRKGFWWAHIGWIFYRDPVLGTFHGYKQYAKDLVADPFILFLDRYYVYLQVLFGLGLLLLGGWSFVIWGIFVRLVFGWHCTWLVNSASHMFGYQSYDSRDEARNCWWVALLSFGEGWHNNHHAFPRSARHGLQWWEFDSSYVILRLMQVCGLVSDLRVSEHLRLSRGNQSIAA
jgi:stearoyl-CoA desaturase (delta-9 desaturase)